MDALAHIKAYLKTHFGNHDIETLMTHFETAVEAKIEAAVAEVKQEIAELRNEIIPPVTVADAALIDSAAVIDRRPGGVTTINLQPGAVAPAAPFVIADQPAAETTTENAK